MDAETLACSSGSPSSCRAPRLPIFSAAIRSDAAGRLGGVAKKGRPCINALAWVSRFLGLRADERRHTS
jgi:hypothetical protein